MPPMRLSSPWVACAIVFVASFCTLVIELIAGRIMAPYIGVSLYTWTSIIGVVLARISLGHNIVGRIYAVSTAGSIVGTFATGFYLIEALGTRSIVWLVGLILIGLGLLIGALGRPPLRAATMTMIAVVLAVPAALYYYKDVFA